ncbi:FGFR1 oncogene partner isoform X2 [Eurytemora carolleeae]|uniref:FGFR1 oncogene partner isoform X2 n=1 Tax=Eurytemora carolleeae TaxID=1294199 RepID=UPI000C78AA61|nr:FGFR1 oncogene partner isoform X2 [Eurytemora carolleeae]|eukprot:XP_023338021.1 FGFR1 oncogene partner-like isoform X2 [Eurytemora affinis]
MNHVLYLENYLYSKDFIISEKMSTVTEEDVELRDLVSTVLDNSGVLGKLKAQLRAHVYSALECGEVSSNSGLVNPGLRQYLDTTTGRLVASLVREFLEFFNLDFTLAVFDPETNIGKDFRYRGRSKLIDALGLTELVDPKLPLLNEIMRLSKVSVLKSESPTPTEISVEDENTSNQTSLAEDPSRGDPPHKLSDYKKCSRVEDTSDESIETSITPGVNIRNLAKESSSTINPLEEKPRTLKKNELQPGDKLRKDEEPPGDSLLKPGDRLNTDEINPGDKLKRKELSPLSDLPPLGSLSSQLGNLPPLSGSRTLGLSPLKKIQPLSKPESKKESDPSPHASLDQTPDKNLSHSGRKELPNLGFGKDHVISEKENTLFSRDKNKEGTGDKNSDKYSDDFSVSEDIEEDLDSFLNSSQSNAEEFTKEEIVINSDVSLKADHVESL